MEEELDGYVLSKSSISNAQRLKLDDQDGRTFRALQLSIRGLDRLLTVHLLLINLFLTTVISKRSKSLWQDGVREVVARVHPVRVHGAEVLDLQLDEGAGQVFRIAEFHGEFVWWQR